MSFVSNLVLNSMGGKVGVNSKTGVVLIKYPYLTSSHKNTHARSQEIHVNIIQYFSFICSKNIVQNGS